MAPGNCGKRERTKKRVLNTAVNTGAAQTVARKSPADQNLGASRGPCCKLASSGPGYRDKERGIHCHTDMEGCKYITSSLYTKCSTPERAHLPYK